LNFGSGRLSDHLMSSYFGFRVVLGRIRLVIRSSSVELFRVLNHIRLDWNRSNQISSSMSNETDPDWIFKWCIFESCMFHLSFNWIKLFGVYHLNPQFIIIYTRQVSFERFVELLIDIIVNIIIIINFII
jgi:hypothetical protein